MGKKKNTGGRPANRNYKYLFRMLFKDRNRLLELYNAVSGRSRRAGRKAS